MLDPKNPKKVGNKKAKIKDMIYNVKNLSNISERVKDKENLSIINQRLNYILLLSKAKKINEYKIYNYLN